MNDREEMIQDYLSETARSIGNADYVNLGAIVDILLLAKKEGRTIYTCGNGGSAATASHMANDLLKGCRVNEKPGFKAFSLVDSVPIVTCLANDYSYEDVFKIELETYAKPGDILIVFSGSGNSKNVVNAAKYAKENDIFVIGFLGRNGGLTLPLCDEAVIAKSMVMEEIEDSHMAFEHAISSALRKTLEFEAVRDQK